MTARGALPITRFCGNAPSASASMSPCAETDRAEPVRDAGGLHQFDQPLRDDLAGIVRGRAAHVGAERFRAGQMPLGACTGGEAIDRRRIQHDAHPVRNQRLAGG